MHVITMPSAGAQRTVVAAFTIADGRAVFDLSRGDPEFINSLCSLGVASIDRGITTHVKPENGEKFLNACLKMFCSTHLTCRDESALDALRQRLPPPNRASIPHSAG
ncbi:hypothetical protein KBC59_02510 [Patescibacteria group bacterium]|nr:hypothetical protein [Patescibacteria group bacterium]